MLSYSIFYFSTLKDIFRDLLNHSVLHCLSILLCGFILDVERSLLNLADGSLNALPGSHLLFTLVFIWIFLDWSMGAFGFVWVVLAFGKTSIFILSLMGFGRRIGDLCDAFFAGEFVFLERRFVFERKIWGIFFLYFVGFLFVVGSFRSLYVFVWWISAELRFFTYTWNFSQSFGFTLTTTEV